MTTVHVVMGNDFPEAVFLSIDRANEFIDKKRAEDDERLKKDRGPRIYWRSYTFEIEEDAS